MVISKAKNMSKENVEVEGKEAAQEKKLVRIEDVANVFKYKGRESQEALEMYRAFAQQTEEDAGSDVASSVVQNVKMAELGIACGLYDVARENLLDALDYARNVALDAFTDSIRGKLLELDKLEGKKK